MTKQKKRQIFDKFFELIASFLAVKMTD